MATYMQGRLQKKRAGVRLSKGYHGYNFDFEQKRTGSTSGYIENESSQNTIVTD